MSSIQQRIRSFELEKWITWTTGLAAFVVAILEFFGVTDFKVNRLLEMCVGLLGLLLVTCVTQSAKRKEEHALLQSTLRAKVDILTGPQEFYDHLTRTVQKAQRYVKDMSCNTSIYDRRGELKYRYYEVRDHIIAKGTIRYMRVEVIGDKEELKKAIQKLLAFADKNFFLRYYPSPPTAIPLLQVISVDDNLFYLGGFSHNEPSIDYRAVLAKGNGLGTLLRDYWQVLWMNAIPLNYGPRINWKELKGIAKNVGVPGQEFDEMIKEIRRGINEVYPKS